MYIYNNVYLLMETEFELYTPEVKMQTINCLMFSHYNKLNLCAQYFTHDNDFGNYSTISE